MAVNPIKLPKKPKKPDDPGPEPPKYITKKASRTIDSGESLQDIIVRLPEGVDFDEVIVCLEYDGYDESDIEVSWPEPTPVPNPHYASQIESWRCKVERYKVELAVYDEKMKVFQKALNERNAIEHAEKIRRLEAQLAELRKFTPPA